MRKKPDHEKKSILVALRMTPPEFDRIEDKAEAAGMKPGRLAVAAALDLEIKPPVPAINRQLYAELARVGGNLNQIARRLNAENRLSGGDLVAALNELSRRIAEARRELIGIKP